MVVATPSFSWLQVPAINLGAEVNVVGEMSYQDALERVSGGRTALGTSVGLVTATLVPEPENPYDERAIRVDVGAAPVGYIARDDTERFHPLVARLRHAGKDATCRARIVGGWDRGNGDTGRFGVRLQTSRRPSPWNGRSAFLPESPWRESLPISFLPGAAGAVPPQGRALVTLEAVGDDLAVRLANIWIGYVVDRIDLANWIGAVDAMGLPCTAALRMHNGTPLIFVADQDAICAALGRLGPFNPRSTRRRPKRPSRRLCDRCFVVWEAAVDDQCPDCGSYAVCGVTT